MLQSAGKPRSKRLVRWPLQRSSADFFHLGDGWTDSRHTRPPVPHEGAVTPVSEFPDERWDDGPTAGVEALLEDGGLLAFPRLPFALADDEQRFLDEAWTDGRAKNISVRWPGGTLRGAAGAAADLAALRGMMERFTAASEALALRLFPHYRGRLQRGNASFRPVDLARRETSWRHDDSRLHVDAFPSNPMRGTRLLRVFCNVNPDGRPRVWRVGEPFAAHARRYLASFTPPLPGAAWLMTTVGLTKRRRTEYDHVMLQLHDHAKADLDFQRNSPQAELAFAPGTTWVVYSDQVPHAAMAGQHLLEQTFLIDVEHLQRPETSPLHTLERLLHRPLR